MMQLPLVSCLLFAAGFDWLEALLPFLFVGFWLVSQVFAVFRRLQGGGRQQPPPLPRFDPARDRPRLPRPAAEDGMDARSDLEKQIAEFLREATGEKKPQAPVNRPTIARSETGSASPRHSPRPEQQRDARRPGSQPPPLTASGQKQRQKSVARREGTIPATATMPQPRQETSESVARHVQDAFSHELTHLRGTITQDDAQQNGGGPRMVAPTQAEELVHLLRNPATVRQMILLREVLDRPVDRW